MIIDNLLIFVFVSVWVSSDIQFIRRWISFNNLSGLQVYTTGIVGMTAKQFLDVLNT